MGLLDQPAPAYQWLDELAGQALPPAVRLLIWAGLAAWASMELYKLLSPQDRITAAKRELRQSQRELNAYDGDLAGAKKRIARVLRAALRRLGLVAPAAVIASIPVLSLIVWLDAAYSLRFPGPRETVGVRTTPPSFEAEWIDGVGSAGTAYVVIRNPANGKAMTLSIRKPAPLLYKRTWWNALIGNPGGYLPRHAPIDELLLDLPRQQVIGAGPSWLRTWETPFFASLCLWALVLMKLRRIA
ncbi:hypothetical protein [Ferruginivarius sediminum]|uniref:DUF106 domain-containing protein n=1 Tax=Ferruginivarius sediminum TaxID=2661937 RepID=A0A369T7G6_9PROT|nr:hypothetical protein [Ferruginivarius sediminum]RDD60295.1 hypothetical protein DRB17_18825 [Ferruginivarius sediminum]